MSNQTVKPGFINQIAASKQSVKSWEGWMRNSATTATASLPSTTVPASTKNQSNQQKKKA